jgi:hypothetical protein
MHRTQRARYKDVPSELSGIRVSFLLGTFLWTSKEKYRGCRSENRLQKTVAISDTKKHRPQSSSNRQKHLPAYSGLRASKLSKHFQSRDGIITVMPRRAPEGLSGFARRGDAGMHRVFRGGWDAPSENPVQT